MCLSRSFVDVQVQQHFDIIQEVSQLGQGPAERDWVPLLPKWVLLTINRSHLYKIEGAIGAMETQDKYRIDLGKVEVMEIHHDNIAWYQQFQKIEDTLWREVSMEAFELKVSNLSFDVSLAYPLSWWLYAPSRFYVWLDKVNSTSRVDGLPRCSTSP